MRRFVSIITINYNGKKFLKDFLNSTLSLDYPKDRYEVIVVDNASTDGSVRYIKKYFPEVKVVKAPKNIGFGSGNNLGIKNAKGELFFLVNNDTFLESPSLKEIVSCFDRWSQKKRIGAVNAKLVLFDSYLPFVLKGASFAKYHVISKLAQPKQGAQYVITHNIDKEPQEELYLPVNNFCEDDFKIAFFARKITGRSFNLYLNSKLTYKGEFIGDTILKKIILDLKRSQLKSSKLNLIQNAGNIVFRDGFGRDRGAEIINYKQYYEPDMGQYDKEEPIPAFCGAGTLLNKEALCEVGFFDEQFFMYYEDTDLSLRLKKAGWEIVYCPAAVIRHIHAASSREWSHFFTFQVEKNRLLFVSKNWPRFLAIKEWFKFLVFETIGSFIYYLFTGQLRKAMSSLVLRLKVNLALIIPFVISLFRTKRLSYYEIKNLL